MNKKIFLIYILLILFLTVSFKISSKNYLVIIAIDIYQNRLSLAGKVDKAEELKNILYSKYEIDNIIGLYDYDATKKNIEETLNKIQTELTSNDTLIFYYSGHGYFNDETKEYFWIPSDAGINETEKNNWIPCSEVVNFFQKSNASQNLLVVDSIFPEDYIDKIDPASLIKPSEEIIKNKSLKKTSQILSSGVQETRKDKNEFAENLIGFLKSNKNQSVSISNLFISVKENPSGKQAVLGYLKNSNYEQNSSFIISEREKPIEVPKEEPEKKENEPEKNIQVEKNTKFSQLININKAGFILLPFSSTLLTIGICMFVTDLTTVNSQINNRLNDSTYTYDQYVKDYILNFTLFWTGIGIMSLGAAMMIIAIPLAVYKPKEKKVSFNIIMGKNIGFEINYIF